ncbi:hypothetical protein [Streptomyces sp. NP160]|uniref:hypothetical protein n=1 Tax=Streptomyces sp. NP160 TaxID=2586637 RepID=UPI0015D5A317|nr:hypothetical protein [Streptomyces sp. NP160]
MLPAIAVAPSPLAVEARRRLLRALTTVARRRSGGDPVGRRPGAAVRGLRR